MSTSSQKHSNLLAAKSALGLSDAPSPTSPKPPSTSASRTSSAASIHSRESKSSAKSASARESAVAASVRDKRSSLHDLSSAARSEARRRSVDDAEVRPARSSFAAVATRSSFRTEESERRSGSRRSLPSLAERRRSAAAAVRTGAAPAAFPAGAADANPPTSSRRDGPSVASSADFYLEEGSRDDSMAAFASAAAAASGGRPRSPFGRGDGSDNLGGSSSNFGMSSSFNNAYEKKVSFDDAERASGGSGKPDMVPVRESDSAFEESTYEDSEFSTLNDSEKSRNAKKVSFTTVGSGSDIVRAAERSGRSPVVSFHSSNASEGRRNEPVSSPHSSSVDDFGESDFGDSETFQDSGTFNESASSSQFSRSDPSDHGNFAASEQSLVSEGTFVPQRFDEMRSLLLNITPLQLEALVAEIFSNNHSASGSHLSVNSSGGNSRAIPPEWKGIRKKAKRFNFRKDAYLGEMSFDELANFAESISLWTIVDNDRCDSYEEAMDIFAIEFERLVSGHQSESSTINSVAEGDAPRQLEDDLFSYVSNNSQDADEGENLRRSLRACSVPELRLVAERLSLDHTVCRSNKTDLIALIESSMPDMLNDSSSDVNSQQRPPPRGYLASSQHSYESNGNAAMYVEESYAQQQKQEQDDRHKRVKFSTDCKQDTSHLIPKREVNQAVWGNYVVNDVDQNGEDIESAQPLVLYDDGRHGANGAKGGKKRGAMKWPEQRRRFIVIGVFVSIVVGIALGLGLGLTREQSEGDASSSTTYVSSPWSMNYGNLLEKTEQPSVSPSKAPKSKGGDEVVILDSTSKKSSKPTQKPTPAQTVDNVETSAPTLEPAALTPAEPYVSGGIVSSSIEVVTNSPTEIALAEFIDNEDEEFGTVSTTVPDTENNTDVAASLVGQNSTVFALEEETQNATEIAITEPTANDTAEVDASILTVAPTDATTTEQPIASSPTAQPSTAATESLYPMLGPVDETGMRMILHGITELSSMGRTQWKMLTSAFIEQFYNHGEKGNDAIQNIVFDVNADIEIDDDELVGDGSLIITFTTTISYHTFSAFLDANTVVDRPFSEEAMRSSYIDYLVANNSKSFIGDVTGVSPIFRSEEVPSEYLQPAASDQEGTTTPTTSTRAETSAPSSAVGSPMPSSLVLTETTAPSPIVTSPSLLESPAPSLSSSSSGTPEPSIKVITALTPRPTLSESSAVTPRPTQNSFSSIATFSPVSSPKVENTFSPVGSGGIDSPFPTSNAFDWPADGISSPTQNSTQIATNSMVYTDSPTPLLSHIATNSEVYTDKPTAEPSIMPTPKPMRRERTAPPTNQPTTASPTDSPTSHPTPSPTATPVLCDLLAPGEICRDLEEVMWEGSLEVGQTHVVKAVGESRRAPRIIAHREAELLFSPADSRRLDTTDESVTMPPQNIAYVGKVYTWEGVGNPVHNKLADTLLDQSDTHFVLNTPALDIIIDLKHLRLIEEVSIVLPDQVVIENVQFGLRYDDGQNTEEQDDIFYYPQSGWLWHDIGGHSEKDGSTMTLSIPKRKARYVTIRLKGGHSTSPSPWSLQRVEIMGYLDGLSDQIGQKLLPMTRAITPNTASRIFTPPRTAEVRIALYSPIGHLLGVIKGRDPTKQRTIFESQVSETDIEPYNDAIWSATLPFNWVEEGNSIVVGCVDSSRPSEVLVHRLQLKDLAQFSEHSITRTKMAIFGSDEDVSKLNSKTFDARKLVRNLHSVIPSATLKWADTDLWHLPYLVVVDKDGKPALVNSEEERRTVTGAGTEIGWEVMKNFLTIRHALAQAGLGLALTMQDGNNSPYASHTSVFMGWSLSKKEDDDESWHWEDLGYWDTLAAAAWTGWVAMKAGDECSNYFIHELGHAQSMQHFDSGAALLWGVENEYPNDGVYTSSLPWGYDSVARQFRTWWDPLDGSGKKDPLNGEGEPPYSQELNCFSQYTPYQAQIAQEWAMSTPVLLSALTSDVPRDGAYQFNTERRQYIPLTEPELRDAAGENAMMPDEVSVPIVTLIGTIGASRDVCQTYPALRGYGNTFELPDPFEPGLPSAFEGASYFVEVRFESGRKVQVLIAVKDVSELSLYSFNIAIDQRPVAVDLYRFVDGSYPNLSAKTETQLLHIRPIELPLENPLQGMPRQLSVGRGWLGDSSKPLLNAFCVSSVECESDNHSIEWRGNVGSDHVIYRSTLEGRNDETLKATVFKVPALREDDSKQYKITVLAARFYNDGQGMSPLLTSDPITGDDSSSLDVTHMIRIWAPWDMNDSLPVGIYRSIPDSFKISADVMASSNADFHHNIIELKVDLFIGTVTAPPTSTPTKRPSDGPTPSPVPVRYHIDWKHGTCVTEGTSTEWAPPYEKKEDCCKEHMTYEYNLCMSRAR